MEIKARSISIKAEGPQDAHPDQLVEEESRCVVLAEGVVAEENVIMVCVMWVFFCELRYH